MISEPQDDWEFDQALDLVENLAAERPAALLYVQRTLTTSAWLQAEEDGDATTLVALANRAAALDAASASRLASSLDRIGEYGAAARVLEALVWNAPHVPDHYFVAAQALKRAKNAERLNRLVELAEHRLAHTIEQRAALVRLYVLSGRFGEAQEEHKALLEAMRTDEAPAPQAFVTLGEAELSQGRLSAAAYCLAQAQRLGAPNEHVQRLVRTVRDMSEALQTTPESLAAAYEYNGLAEHIFVPDALYDVIVDNAAPLSDRASAKGLLLCVNSLAIGGSERNAITMANEFAARGDFGWVKILVAEPSENSAFRDLLRTDVELVSLSQYETAPDEWAPSPHLELVLKAMTPGHSQLAIRRFCHAFASLKPDQVHVYAADVRCIHAASAAAIVGVPTVINPGGFSPKGRNRGDDYAINARWMQAALRALLRAPFVRMLNCSLTAMHDYQSWLAVTDAKFGVNYFGLAPQDLIVDDERILALRAEYGIIPGDFVVGGVFRFEEVKRPQLWVEVAAILAARVPRSRFLMVGDGPLRATVESLVAQFQLEDRFILPGRQIDVANWYALMSVYLQTSSSEGLGNVLLEAQALGVPVVAPLIGGMPETLIHGRTGWLAETDTAEAIADRLMWIAENPEWRDDARHHARSFIAERFDRERMIEDSLRAYRLAQQPI